MRIHRENNVVDVVVRDAKEDMERVSESAEHDQEDIDEQGISAQR